MGDQTSSIPGVGWIRSISALAISAVVLAFAAPGLAAAEETAQVSHQPSARYLVSAVPGHLSDLQDELAARDIAVKQTLGIIDTAVVDIPASAVAGLQTLSVVASVTPDVALEASSNSYDPVTEVGSAYNSARLMGAPDAWSQGTADRASTSRSSTPAFHRSVRSRTRRPWSTVQTFRSTVSQTRLGTST